MWLFLLTATPISHLIKALFTTNQAFKVTNEQGPLSCIAASLFTIYLGKLCAPPPILVACVPNGAAHLSWYYLAINMNETDRPPSR
ncbi:hypothetical protein V8F33_011472 [Rhypophila sp. PSN 637]